MLVLDHCIFSLQTAGGISKWWAEHTRRMQLKLGGSVAHVGLYRNKNVHFSEAGRIGDCSDRAAISKLWPLQSVIVPREARIFHSSYFRRCADNPLTRQILTFHDDIALTDTSFHGRVKRGIIERCVRDAHFVHCISHFTKRKLLSHFNWLQDSRVRVVHHGFDVGQKSEPYLPIQHLDQSYVLFVGNRGDYKRGTLAFKALQNLGEVHLVCVGGGSLSSSERSLINSLGVAARLHHIGSISNSHLTWLYQNAVALWYPSSMEGFGMPVIEAAAQGCPVLAASGHAVEEIGGEWPILSPDPSPSWLAEQTRRLMKEKTFAQALRETGPELAQKFSWQRYESAMASLYVEAGLYSDNLSKA